MLSLPLPLLLLIHIHLLGYPHADEPEYDEHVFNVKMRGLRDRTKTMEDLCYFLVGKIEPKPRLKSLFPTYPCSHPSDSVAFRAVLAKYLEGLRNHVVRPETSSKGKSPSAGTPPDPWWWKDVVVRKSLLEECTGNRFERMIIALSTHALFANTTSESLSAIASDASVAFSLLPTLPRAHVSLEATIRGTRRAWERSAVLLQQRQADSKHPKVSLNVTGLHLSEPHRHARAMQPLVANQSPVLCQQLSPWQNSFLIVSLSGNYCSGENGREKWGVCASILSLASQD
ncbi:hypothetical protein BJV74DRAFT_393505 [Russula compacta]|nr:hypothetical protein BJV74DRAFT_393505 [Russula compacta]